MNAIRRWRCCHLEAVHHRHCSYGMWLYFDARSGQPLYPLHETLSITGGSKSQTRTR